MILRLRSVALALSLLCGSVSVRGEQDPFTWLEDLTGKRSLSWVHAENEKTLRALKSDPRFARFHEAALAILTRPSGGAKSVSLRDGWVYRVLQDDSHPRGLWQRTPLGSYMSKGPQWRALLDVDRLSRESNSLLLLQEGAAKCLGHRCMIGFYSASARNEGLREFDVESGAFVSDGFVLPAPDAAPAIRRDLEWKDASTLYVAEHANRDSADTEAGALIVKEWSRGTPFATARHVFRGANGLMQIFTDSEGRREHIVSTATESFKLRSAAEAVRMYLPPFAYPRALHRGQWILQMSRDVQIGHRTWKEGSLVSIADVDILRPEPSITPILEPAANEVQPFARATRDGILVSTLENVRGRLSMLRFDGKQWHRTRLPMPDFGKIDFGLTAPDAAVALLTYEDYLTPPTVYAIDTDNLQTREVQRREDQFDARGSVLEQLWATSRDGTRVPYFIVRPKALKPNGQTPALLSAYGNSGAIDLPYYDGVLGKLWIEQGGVYVWASIRGGGELGPKWYVKKTERRRTYEDFAAVAQDLIRRGITSPPHLGIQGFSMGGCLVGVMFNERPELFNAAISKNGMLDQIGGYNLVNGERIFQARGMESVWGSLDIPEELAFLQSTSPYQNLRKRPDAFPPLVTTSTDDSLPAFEARKYVARLASFDMPYYFYESPEGGHGYGATPQQVALHHALVFTYLARRLRLR